jgi:hypothetical protein
LNSTHYSDKDSPSVTYQPVLDDIVLFPSSLPHRTIPFSADVDRIIVAFDLLPNRRLVQGTEKFLWRLLAATEAQTHHTMPLYRGLIFLPVNSTHLVLFFTQYDVNHATPALTCSKRKPLTGGDSLPAVVVSMMA